jgi:hypothetical protein
MEIEQNVTPNTPPLNQSPDSNSKGGDIGVILLNVFLALVTIFLLGYIAYKNGYINLDNILNIQEDQDESEDENIDFDNSTPLETFTGDVLSAIVPSGWSIEEYFDGDGTSMVMEDGEYTGLTGIKIFNEEKEIMHIEAVYGIGFEACPEIPRFLDSSTEYEEEQENIAAEIEETVTYLDYTNTPYSEFEWLGKRIRRLSTTLYYDRVEGDEYFEPQCEKNFLNLEMFGFEDSQGYKGTVYMYTISQDATEEELETLDKILVSMIAN